jgi:squalene-associated FAD-dependent desaturase
VPAFPKELSDKSVIVVGGGLAGIAAALALAKRGVQVRLIESKHRLGGRTGSFIDVAGGTEESLDYCQHVGMGCCTNLRQLTDWLGQKNAWTEYKQLHAYSATSGYQRLSALPFVPAPLHLFPWLFSWPGLRLRDRMAVARGMLILRSVRIDVDMESRSALDWLVARKQTVQSIQNFWNTIIVSALGEELSRVNVASLCKVMQDGFLNHREAFHLLVPNRPLDELFNRGASVRLQQLGVVIELGVPITRIARQAGGITAVARDRSYSADAVVLAVPWHRLSHIQTDSTVPGLPAVAAKADQLQASPITGIHTWWDRPWLEQRHAMIVGQLCQWIFTEPVDSTATCGDEFYYQIVISASRSLPNGDPATLRKLICDDLNKVFPKARHASLLRLKAVRDPQAVFSVSPESMQNRADCRALGNDILLAGDWTRTGWPATMEGAVLSGFSAAEALFSHWGHPEQVRAAALGKPTKED